jgi:hypothetical protein
MRELTKPSSEKCTLAMYINFLLGEPRRGTCNRMSEIMGISHDSINRFLQREEYEGKDIIELGKIELEGETLSVDDTVLEKPYSEETEIIGYYWSGKHKKTVKGINQITLVYTDIKGTTVAVNYRIYNKTEGKTKNDYFIEMLEEVLAEGIKPSYVTGDSWYASQENLKTIRDAGIGFLFGLERNRLCCEEGEKYKQIQRTEVPETGLLVELKGVGEVKVFRMEFKNGFRHYVQYTPDLKSLVNLTYSEFKEVHNQHWQIEQFHRVTKQVCNIEKFQVRTTRAIENHIFCAICSFIKLEFMRVDNIIANWYQVQRNLFNQVIHAFIQASINTEGSFESQLRSLVNA